MDATQHAPAIPYTRLSLFYFVFFALTGTFMPYWTLYLQHLSFNAEQIGLMMGMVMATRIIAPNIWGYLADVTGERLRIVRFGALLSALCFVAVFFTQQFWWLTAVLVAYSFFQNAILAQFEAVTMGHLRSAPSEYSRIRLWGSVGFIVTVLGAGALLARVPTQTLPVMVMVLAVAIWVSSLLVPNVSTTRRRQAESSFVSLLMRPEVLAFFAVNFLNQLAHGPYYTFYSIYMEAQGHSRALIGVLWGLGVVAEVWIFTRMPHWLPRIGVRMVLLLSALLAALRWALIGLFPESLPVLVLAQLLHAASFGSSHAAGIAWVYARFGQGHQGQGQALYSATGFGLGGACGAWLSGVFWDDLGPLLTYGMAMATALLAAWVIYRFIPADAVRN